MIAPVRAQSLYEDEPQRLQCEQKQFLRMLPQIERQARRAFRWLQPELKEELIAEAVATAYCLFAQLLRRGKAELAYASPIAIFAIRRVLVGRKATARPNIRDVLSEQARAAYGVVVERLDVFDEQDCEWREALVDDRRATPADIAAARIDVGAWLSLLSIRNRSIAIDLAMGETAKEVARRFQVSPGRITQIRQWLEASWKQFQAGGGRPQMTR